MDINHLNFGMERLVPLKLWKWIVDVYNNSRTLLLFFFLVFPPLVPLTALPSSFHLSSSLLLSYPFCHFNVFSVPDFSLPWCYWLSHIQYKRRGLLALHTLFSLVSRPVDSTPNVGFPNQTVPFVHDHSL